MSGSTTSNVSTSTLCDPPLNSKRPSGKLSGHFRPGGSPFRRAVQPACEREEDVFVNGRRRRGTGLRRQDTLGVEIDAPCTARAI
eukprot:31316-Pelagococcus_subviridis.AAC.11